MRGGQVLDRRELFWEGVGQITPELLLSEVLPQIYDRTTFIPKEIHLPVPIEGEEALVEWLSEKKGERVYLRMPSRGPKAERVELAMHNAELAHKRRFRAGGRIDARRHRPWSATSGSPSRRGGSRGSTSPTSRAARRWPRWWSGRRGGCARASTAASTSATSRQPDDFASMRQAVERRYRRVLEEIGAMPDLILIDGGRGQLNAALAALAELGVEETLDRARWPSGRRRSMSPRRAGAASSCGGTTPGLRLLQEIRDEAHRFAVSSHRARRSARTLHSRSTSWPASAPAGASC